MKYFSHYIWESGSEEKENLNPISVVLQQIRWRRQHYLLACICEGEGSNKEACEISGYVTAHLVEWFHGQFAGSLCRIDAGERVQKSLFKELGKIEGELWENGEEKTGRKTYHILGMLMCEQDFLCFARGNYKGYLFNRRFNRKQRIHLEERFFGGRGNSWKDAGKDDKPHFVLGHLQKGVGVLLCNREFDRKLSAEEMVEVLGEDDLDEEQMKKRLKELWMENKFRGGTDYAGAVYFRIR